MCLSKRLAAFTLGVWLTLIGSMAVAQVDIGFGGAATGGDEPVEITADRLAINQTTGEAVFTGNVLVVQGPLRMTADEIMVTYAEVDGSTDVREVAASGGVLISQGDDAAEGETALYNVASGVLTMAGDVIVTQGPTAIAGERLVVDMETGNGTVEGRVRTVLRPE